MPEDAPFPSPNDSPRVKTHFLNPPKPPAALDEVMQAVEGDGSAWSYLSASILRRQLGEFGAMWHGATGWITQRLLDDNPLKASKKQGISTFVVPSDELGKWKWLETEPKQWAPQVRVEKELVTVTFYTYSPLYEKTIYCYTDTFRPGSYSFKTDRKKIATGGLGPMP
jgi:hypothetical protein